MNADSPSKFLDAYRGSFTSIMRWPQLGEFWTQLNKQADNNWYIYAIGEQPPEAPEPKEKLLSFIKEIDVLLHKEHDDPNNLGVSCGFSDNPPLPGWILSKLKPVELESALNPPNNRRRWWKKIFNR